MTEHAMWSVKDLVLIISGFLSPDELANLCLQNAEAAKRVDYTTTDGRWVQHSAAREICLDVTMRLFAGSPPLPSIVESLLDRGFYLTGSLVTSVIAGTEFYPEVFPVDVDMIGYASEEALSRRRRPELRT
jgi:hypothetical protein